MLIDNEIDTKTYLSGASSTKNTSNLSKSFDGVIRSTTNKKQVKFILDTSK